MPLLIGLVFFFALLPIFIFWKVTRRLIFGVPIFLYIALTIAFNGHDASGLMTYLAIGLVIWRLWKPVSFDRYIWRHVRASWRHWRVYDKAWKTTIKRLYLNDPQKFKTIWPKIVKVKCDSTKDMVLVRFLRGQDPEDYRTYASNLAHAFGSKICYVQDAEKTGHVWLIFPRGDTLRSVVPAIPIPEEPSLDDVQIGIYEDGASMSIGIRGTHYYVAGSTGSGKGSVIDSIIRNLAVAIRDGWVEIHLCDPKGGMQLKPYLPMAKAYASRYEKMAQVIHACALSMQERSEELSDQKIRLHKPSVKYPQVLLIIDEMAALTLYLKESNTALFKQLQGDLGLILTEGRAIGYSVIACAQDPRKEVNSLRNLFPGRLGLQFDEENDVDLAMGKGAINKGALCHKIPKNPKHYEDWAGTGYELYEGGTTARKFRTAYPTEIDIDFMVGQYAIKKELEEHVNEEKEPDDERPRSTA